MKTRLLWMLSVLIIAIGFSSCMHNMRAEKRHYRNGFYFNNWHRDQRTSQPDTVVVASGNIQETVLTDESIRDTVYAHAASGVVQQENPQISTPQSEPVYEDGPGTTQDSATVIAPAEKKQKHFPLHYNGPAEARPLSLMLWIGFIALLLGIVAIICAFAPAIGAAPVFGAAAPFLIIGALVLGFIVARKARKLRDTYAQTDPETARFYHKMRFKALVLGGVATGIVVLFVLTMIAVIAALSNFH